jgi:hypothetical protein
MPLIEYEQRRFQRKRREIIDKVNLVLNEYAAQGYTLTCRQLYYQFVARGWVPENTLKQYNDLCTIVKLGRLAGVIDWDHIEDRTRNRMSNSHWESPEEIVGSCARDFRIDKWADQDQRVEVWMEKDAVGGILGPECERLDVPYFSCRGFCSTSEMWAAGQRIKNRGQRTQILYLGDHDPSGIDMLRDIDERMRLFTDGWAGVRRIALTRDQIDQYNLPPNWAKESDSRHGEYVAEHGEECWELDALEPGVLVDLIKTEVAFYRDEDRWAMSLAKEQEGRDWLVQLAKEGLD